MKQKKTQKYSKQKYISKENLITNCNGLCSNCKSYRQTNYTTLYFYCYGKLCRDRGDRGAARALALPHFFAK